MQERGRNLSFKVCIAVVAFSALFTATLFARPAVAQTAEQLAQLQMLMQLVASLQQQLASLQGGGVPTTPAGIGVCPSLYRTLSVGASGSDVSELQQFLIGTGDFTYGSVTGYFGPATEEAIKRFQCRAGVICEGGPESTGYGSVGPATRAQVARMCGYAQPVTPISQSFTPTLTTCAVGSVILNQGESRTFFLNSIAPVGTSCQSALRTCQAGGVASGNPAYASPICSVQNIQCSVGSTVMQIGETRTFYKNSTVPYGSTCQSTQRTCQSSGTVTGDSSYSAASCNADATPASCTIPASGSTAASTVPHGTSYTFYSAATVPAGQSCGFLSQVRTCNNGTFTGSSLYAYPACTVGTSCTVGGITVPHGTSRYFYSTSTLSYTSNQQCSAISQLRTCSNGVLSGDAAYSAPSCVVSKDCTENGILVLNGTSRTFYSQSSVLFGQSCDAFKQTRTCTNNALSGSGAYKFGSCQVGAAKSCTVGEKTLASGSGYTFYSVSSVRYNQTCDLYAQNRVCNDGIMTGSSTYSYASCAPAEQKNCTLDGQTFAPGKHKVYSQRTVSGGQSCNSVAQVRTCTNGVWSGDAKYDKARCAPEGKEWCKQDKMYVKNDSSKLFYATRSVAYGRICYGIPRKCNDGTLGGNEAYQYSSCRVEAPASCELDGKTIPHGGSATFYSAEQGSEEETCAQIAKIRTCNDGVLGGEVEFQYASCVDPVDANDPE